MYVCIITVPLIDSLYSSRWATASLLSKKQEATAVPRITLLMVIMFMSKR